MLRSIIKSSIAITAIIGFNLSNASPVDKIIGGDVMQITDYPWMAAITVTLPQAHEDYFTGCAGVLVASNKVVTLGRCAPENNPYGFSLNVVFGIQKPSDFSDARKIKIESVERHQVSAVDQVAVLTLAEHVYEYEPIKLAQDDQNLEDTATVIGWGTTEIWGPPEYPDELMGVEMPMVDLGTCKQIYDNLPWPLPIPIEVTGKMLCAGGEGGAASGATDSGGPMMRKDRQSGEFYLSGIIPDWSVNAGDSGFPSVFLNVAKLPELLS